MEEPSNSVCSKPNSFAAVRLASTMVPESSTTSSASGANSTRFSSSALECCEAAMADPGAAPPCDAFAGGCRGDCFPSCEQHNTGGSRCTHRLASRAHCHRNQLSSAAACNILVARTPGVLLMKPAMLLSAVLLAWRGAASGWQSASSAIAPTAGIHDQVRPLEQRGRLHPVLRIDAVADAAGNGYPVAFDGNRKAKRL